MTKRNPPRKCPNCTAPLDDGIIQAVCWNCPDVWTKPWTRWGMKKGVK